MSFDGGGLNNALLGAMRQASVFVDRSASGPLTNTTTEGGDVPLPPDGLPADGLQLVAFIDRSIIEVFALGGRGRVASRIYPQDVNGDWGLSAFGDAGTTAQVEAWALGDAFPAGSPPPSA